MVKCVCQKIFNSKATVSKFPAETGHKGTLAAEPVIKKVTRCHLLPCALYCSSVTSTTRRRLQSLLPVNLKGSTLVDTAVTLVGLCSKPVSASRLGRGRVGRRREDEAIDRSSALGYGSNVIWDAAG